MQFITSTKGAHMNIHIKKSFGCSIVMIFFGPP